MKQSMIYIPTTKEVNSSAVTKSHILGLKAGMMHQHSSGIYSYLPLANMIMENITNIIDEEFEKIGANKIVMPLLEPAELWQESGRWDPSNKELFRVVDRHEREYALAPTHEEVATDLVKNQLKSYKKYPLNIYQINTKLRDERRPRYGFLRAREFLMMDAYTFATDMQNLMENYYNYYKAYENIFTRIGLKYRVVDADNGTMGGKKSNEFMALAQIGEDIVVYEEDTEYAANIEIAPVYLSDSLNEGDVLNLTMVDTPDCKTIDEVTKLLNYKLENALKAVCFEDSNNNLIICFTSGDREINDVKVANLLGCDVEIASSQTLEKFNIIQGYVGPIERNDDITYLFDNSIAKIVNGVCGANKENMHYINFNFKRDLDDVKLEDISLIKEGEKMTKDSSACKFTKGIEVGHIFALGDKYTKALNVEFLDKNQKLQTPLMASYGIGISRLLSSIIEQNNDDNGIILPKAIAPFDIHVISLDYNKNDDQRVVCDNICSKLQQSGYKVLVDDRDERPGSKFKDADLIGMPYQVVIGRKFSEGIVEVKTRETSEKIELEIDDLLSFMNKEFNV